MLRYAHGREPAQVVVLFAVSLVAMLAMVAVTLDGGTLYVQRRTAQNAADAAVLAGARALQQSTAQTSTTIGDAICTYLQANAFGKTPTVASARFVDTSGTPGQQILINGCSGNRSTTIPPGTSGIYVKALIGPYDPYLAGLVGVGKLRAEASATAQVGVLSIPRPDLTPLAGCGPDMLVDGKSPIPFRNILNPDNSINPLHYFVDDLVLQGSQMTQNEGPNCPDWNGSSSAWKGKVDISGVTGPLTPPFSLPVDTGNGSIDSWVSDTCILLYGPGGDPDRIFTAAASKCYLLVPIAAPPNLPNEANIVTMACFKVYDGGNAFDKWRGVLVPITRDTCNYGVFVPSWTWTAGNGFSETQVMLTS